EPDCIVANVVWPTGNKIAETAAIIRKQGAKGFFESGQVACNGRQETIRGLLRSAHSIAISAVPPSFVYQLSQSHRRSAGLVVEPIPMPREEGDPSRNNAQPGAPTPASLT